jgi:hypothetical protein
MAGRQYVQKEWRLLSYWLAQFHPNADISMNVRLGPKLSRKTALSLSELPSTVSRVFHRYADAVFVESGEATIVEAKLDPDPGIFSQLIHYARLFRMDASFTQFASKPLHLVALVYSDDPTVAIEAPMYGIKWEVYQPNLQELTPPQVRFSSVAGEPVNVPLPDNWASRLQSWGIKLSSESG